MTPSLRTRAALNLVLLIVVIWVGSLTFKNITSFPTSEDVAFMALNFGAMLVGMCLIATLVLDKHYDTYSRASVWVLAGVVVILCMDSLAELCWKVFDNPLGAFRFFNLEYYLTTVFIFILMISLKEFLHPDQVKYRRYLFASAAPVLFQSVLLLQNLFTHNVWYMDGADLIHKEYYLLVFLAPFVQSVIYLVACFHLSEKKRIGLMYAIFILVSLVTLLFMGLAIKKYYSTPLYLSTLFPLMLVIPYGYRIRGVELRSGRKGLKMKKDARNASRINMSELDSTLMQMENLNIVPETVSEALSKFRKFIKDNMEFLDNPSLVPLEKELEFTKAYLYLEKLRYKGKLLIEYHVDCTSFCLPSLSMQVLVENAVKHGISKRPEGGKVTITAEAFKDCFMITVTDNGVGFDTNAPHKTGRSHIGIDNIRSRLAEMANGSLYIESEEGVGTTSTVIIPKPSVDE